MSDQASGTSSPKVAPASKQEAIKRAMEKLGFFDAGRAAIVEYAKKEFGMTIDPNHVSTAAADFRRAAKEKASSPSTVATVKPTPKPKPIPTSVSTPAPSSNGKHSEGISLADIQATKELLGRIGTAEMKTLIELLG